MKLLSIGSYLSTEWATPQAMEVLAPHLRKAGHEVVLRSRYANRWLRMAEMIGGILCEGAGADLALIDTFSGAAFGWAYVCGLLLRLLGKPHVAVLHGGNLPSWAGSHPSLVRQYLQGASAVVAVSNHLASGLSEYRPDIRIIPNTLPVERYEARPGRPWKPRYLWLRRFHDIYNPEMAVRVFARIAENRSEARLTMAGTDAGRLGSAKSLARSLGVAHQVRFAGKLTKEKIYTLSRDHDFFLHTSRIDNQPITVLEAMALGLPVIGTNVGGMRHLVAGGQTGILVRGDDDSAMAGACEELLHRPKQADNMSRAARRAAHNYAWDTVGGKWERLFADVVPRAKSRLVAASRANG